MCGDLEFDVYLDTSDTAPTAPWAAVTTETNGKLQLTIDTNEDLTLIDDESSVVKTLQIKTNLVSYTDIKHYTEVTVTINAATCDCQYLLWTSTPHPSAVSEIIMVETP